MRGEKHLNVVDRLFFALIWGLSVFASPCWAHASEAQVRQSLLIDASQQMGFDEARAADFGAFNGAERQDIANKTGWLRLSVAEKSTHTEATYLLLRPTLYREVSLFTPSPEQPGQWKQTLIAPAAMAEPIDLGVLAPGRPVYLRLSSAFPVRMANFVGPQQAVQKRLQKIDLAVTVFVTSLLLMLLIVSTGLAFSLFGFTPLKLAMCALMATVASCVLLTLGYGTSALGLAQSAVLAWQPPLFVATLAASSSVVCLLANHLFPGGRWVRGLWVVPALMLLTLAVSPFNSGLALKAAETLREVACAALLLSLLAQAGQTPQQLGLLSQKAVFLALLMIPAQCFLVGSKTVSSGTFSSFSSFGAAAALATHEVDLPSHLFLITLLPLGMFLMAHWSFNLARRKHVGTLAVELDKMRLSLETETQRLERQRQFTAMLSHELKNPLTASHMALSNIQQRLALDDPARLRADAIRYSLEEIDAIIERCAEVDKYEQGQVPLQRAPFSVAHLLAALTASNANERIYSLTRGVSQDLLITSDITYLKVILNNLLTNALKYSPPDSLVELSLEHVQTQPQCRLTFRVSNEVGAAGTPDPARVFERYYRAEAVRHQSGAGLGLWLAQSMAHALGSELVMVQDGAKLRFSFSMVLA